jgi:hypothetical protein
MKKIVLTFLAGILLSMNQVSAQIVLNEIQPDDENLVEIKNIGDNMVDISSYFLCSFPTYSQLNGLTLESGSLFLIPGAIVVLSGHNMSPADGELALYLNNQWPNSEMILDYVEWGSTGHMRSSVAQAAEIWANGDFVVPTADGTSLAWDGGGDASSNWMVDAEPTFGAENSGGCDGGTVSTVDGLNTVYTCTQDGVADIVEFESDGASDDSFTFIITSDTGEILGVPPGNSNDFDVAPQGTCLVWGLSYTGVLLAEVGMNALTDMLSDDCYDLSDNSIEVIRTDVDGSTVYTDSDITATYTCTQDGEEDVVNFFNYSESDAAYSYIITAPDGTVLGLPDGMSNDFDGAPAGICWVWGASYVGEIIIEVGQNVNTDPIFSECGELSANYIEVIREFVDGGTVATDMDETTVYTCTQDGVADVVNFTHMTEADGDYAYIITSSSNEILGLPGDSNDFDEAPAGVCRVWGVSYTGNFLALVGDQLDQISISDMCYGLSENYIEIVRDQPSESIVSTDGGDDIVVLCVQDDDADVVNFDNNATSMFMYDYIITDDQNNVLGLPTEPMNDFNGAPAGVCRVWGISHSGDILLEVGDNIDDSDIADGCFMLSENYIMIERHDVTGGMVTTVDDETSVTIVIDGDADVIEFQTDSESAESYAYIVTDVDDNVLTVLDANSNDFNQAEPGECHLYGASYTGDLEWTEGDPVGDVTSTGCYELSENWVTIIRDMADDIGESLGLNLVAFPNPVVDVLTIGTGESVYDINVFGLDGQIIMRERGYQVDMSDYPTGIYLLQAWEGDKFQSFTIQKQ